MIVSRQQVALTVERLDRNVVLVTETRGAWMSLRLKVGQPPYWVIENDLVNEAFGQ